MATTSYVLGRDFRLLANWSYPALYECTLCKGEFVWEEGDGEAGPFCDACSKKVHHPRRPRKIRDLTPAEATRIESAAMRSDDV